MIIPKGKALAAIVCVSKYDNLKDLKGTPKDRTGLKKLFEKGLEYETKCWNKDKITYEEFDAFLHDVRSELVKNAKKYEAFIFAFSGHGNQNSIYLSDGKTFGRVELYKWFNGIFCMKFKDKLKWFLIDACKGGAKAKDLNRTSKNSEAKSSLAPDDHIVVFNSTTDEYVAWENPNEGGVMMQSFIKVIQQIEPKKSSTLYQISCDTAQEMSEMGKKLKTAQTLNAQFNKPTNIYFCK